MRMLPHLYRVMIVAAIVTIGSTTATAIPQLMNYQGILLDGSGNAVTTTTSVEFGIWTAPSGGTELWSESRSIAPDTLGRFNILLGAVSAIPDSVFSADAYLSITVDTDPEMTPRQRIVSVGYSYRVGSIDGAAGGNITSDVSIGSGHALTGSNSFVVGEDNDNAGDWSTISGGRLSEVVNGNGQVIGGGRAHHIEGGQHNTVSGGLGGSIYGNDQSVVSGGASNQIDSGGYWNVIDGGFGNHIYKNQYAVTIGGGLLNKVGSISVTSLAARAAAPGDSVSGATIAGGMENEVTGNFATVAGGRGNTASGYAAFAAGSGAHAGHPGSFVWSDSAGTMTSTGENQFLIAASGGVGIGTDSPTEQLEVNGIIYSSTGGIRFPDNSVQTTAAGGASSGWNDIGPVVALIDPSDSVGVGTSTPTAKLDVSGDMNIGEKLRVGQGHTNIGANTFVAGFDNHADGDFSSVAGGSQNMISATNAFIGGGSSNTITQAFATIGGGIANSANGNRATIAGGYGNAANGFIATIAGGEANIGSGDMSAIGGGVANVASGLASTVPGGMNNRARGEASFAAGSQAHASHSGSIVMYANTNNADGDSAYSTGPGQFVIRADSGFFMATDQGEATISATHFLSTSTGAFLSKTGVWSSVSDASKKENFRSVEGDDVLRRLADMPVTQWNFRSDPGTVHMGPTAQDFRAAFGLGPDDRHITTIDADGVALAAIKALHEENQRLKGEVAELRAMMERVLEARD